MQWCVDNDDVTNQQTGDLDDGVRRHMARQRAVSLPNNDIVADATFCPAAVTTAIPLPPPILLTRNASPIVTVL